MWWSLVSDEGDRDVPAQAAACKCQFDGCDAEGFAMVMITKTPPRSLGDQTVPSTFRCPADTARPSKLFRYTQVRRQESDRNDAWTVGYLQKKEKATGEPKGGQGFSKNWKGFAMDLVSTC